MESSPAIQLIGATKRFATPSGGVYTALQDLDVAVERGEFCAVVGPTGCGKSTTLTLVAGLERPSAGQVLIDGEPVRGVTPGVGFVFQNDAVFPWKTRSRQRRRGPEIPGQPGDGRPRRARATGCAASACRDSRTVFRTNCRAECASVWRWRRA